MLNLLKESSRKSPYQSKFGSGKTKSQSDDASPRGLKLSFKFSESTVEVTLEVRFFVVLFLTLCLYVFGGETGNLWCYLMASVGLGIVLLGTFVPLLQVMETSVHFHLPSEAVARERLNLRVKVTRKNWWGFAARFVPIKWLLVKIKLARIGEAENMLRPIMVDHLINEAWVVAQTPRLRRGVYNLENIELFSCYPFGLAWWSKRYRLTEKLAGELLKDLDENDKNNIYAANMGAIDSHGASRVPQMIVFPRINNVDGNFLYRLRAAGDSALFFSSSRPIAALSSASVRSLREFRSGDSPRFIHWPSSAKTGKLMIREFESEGLPGFDVLLDLTCDWKNEDQFELAVSITLSLLQLGFKMGGAPELFVIPSLDEDLERLPDVLSDLPPIARGIGWASQILARVEALEVKDINYQVRVPQVGISDTLALLTVRPSDLTQEEADEQARLKSQDETDYVMNYKDQPKKADKLPADGMRGLAASQLRQVDLWVLSRASLEADGQRGQGRGAPIPMHAQGSGDRRTAEDGAAPKNGRILSSLAEFEELAHL
ncbi:MAG: DUF58 domain-containing protein [Candidatus Obscuribacter sp.]|nr:DUF58 domain-containing protein [Candidatus Obscuribacter sp.]